MARAHDWSLMHIQILGTIFEFLKDSEPDRRRVSAVCTSWRSAISLLPAALDPTLSLPDITRKGQTFSCSLTKFTFYILSSDENPSRVWLIRVQQPEPDKWVLRNPYSSSSSLSAPRKGGTLNLLGNFRVLQAFKSYGLALAPVKAHARKVIVIPKLKSALVLFKSGQLSVMCENEWIDFETSTTDHCYKDIVSFQDEFYAIDVEGILIKITLARDDNRKDANASKPKLVPVLITSTTRLRLDEFPYLVTSNGNLYLIIKKVDISLKHKPVVECRSYVLNKRSVMWELVNSLRNRVFFLFERVSFSISATDLGWSRGNFIYFRHKVEDSFNAQGFRLIGREYIWVYNLNDSKITTGLKDFPQPVFWPPPKWVTLTPNWWEWEL